jgi:hypothetical protein
LEKNSGFTHFLEISSDKIRSKLMKEKGLKNDSSKAELFELTSQEIPIKF